MSNHDKDSRRALKWLRPKTIGAIDRYLGKQDLLRTYEQLNIHDDYTAKLRKKVRKTRKDLKYRGL